MSKFQSAWGVLGILIVACVVSPSATSVLLQNLANTQLARAATAPPDRAALENAQTYLEQARQFANEPRLSLAQARLALAQNEPSRALAALAQTDPLDFIALWLRGNAAQQTGRVELALTSWRAAGAFTYFENQAQRALDKHDWGQAEQFARHALALDPDVASMQLLLGEALSRQDVNSAEAWRALERAEQLAPNDELRAVPISRQAEILAAQGRYAEALAMFARARHIAPLDARPRTGYALAQVQLDASTKPQAIALLTQVVNDSPWYTAAYIALAQLAENATDAEAWLRRGLEKNPNDARLLLPLGELYAQQGRVTEARTTFELALKYATRVDNRAALERALEQLK